MSGVNANTESLFAQEAEFHPSKPRSQPMTTKGHKPGVKVGKDAVPEFHAETHPPGTAPRENAFAPRPIGEVPVQPKNYAVEDLGGVSSAQVDQGYGKPMQGETSQELHGGHRKKERSGLEGVGASGGPDPVRQKGADLPAGVERGHRLGGYEGAENMEPVNAENLASERKVPQRAYDYTQSNTRG